MRTTEADKRAKRCCFTGHRPEKLGISEKIVCDKIKTAIDLAIENGMRTFICGMSRGFDLWAGRLVIQKKQINPEIRLICATPYIGFEERWIEYWKQLYFLVASQSDYRVAISKQYASECFQRRNEWMVTHSSMVIAAYNGESGGTKNTIQFAQRCGVPVHNILDIRCY